jgi:hypothetical protein
VPTSASTGVDDAQLVALVAEVAARAVRLETEGVTRTDVGRLARAGLLAAYGPPELGGLSAAAQRELAEQLSGASPDLWFVWYQHGPVAKYLNASENEPLKAAHLADLCAGGASAAWPSATCGPPARRCSPRASTAGGRCAARSRGAPAGACTTCCWSADRRRRPARRVRRRAGRPAGAGQPRRAGAGRDGGHEHPRRHLRRPAAARREVVLRKDFDAWAAGDSVMNRNVQPSTFGIAVAALDLLAPVAARTAEALRSRLLDVRTQAYLLMDTVDPGEEGDRRLALRAQALLLALECCTALLASRGGRGMGLDDPAQRLLRAAAFQLVHSQAAHIREATLDALVA